MGRPWEIVFKDFIPEQLKELGVERAAHLDAFAALMAMRDSLTMSASYNLIVKQVKAMADTAKDTKDLAQFIRKGQKEANRQFTPTVVEKMRRAYSWCRDEKGKHILGTIPCPYK